MQVRSLPIFLVWSTFAGSLGFLTFEGAVSCGLPGLVSAGLAVALTCSGSIFAARFRSSRCPLDLVGVTLALTLATGLDFANLSDTIQTRAGASVAVAVAGVDAEGAEVDALRGQVTVAEEAWREAKDLAEAERIGGKVSGHAGNGRTFDLLTAQARTLEDIVRRRESALSDAIASSKAAKVGAVEASSGRHLLATVPGWVLLIGAAGLEIVLALLGWSLGHGAQPAPAEVQPVTTSDKATDSESFPPLPALDDAEDDGKKVIHVSADELKLLSKLAKRGYRSAA